MNGLGEWWVYRDDPHALADWKLSIPGYPGASVRRDTVFFRLERPWLPWKRGRVWHWKRGYAPPEIMRGIVETLNSSAKPADGSTPGCKAK